MHVHIVRAVKVSLKGRFLSVEMVSTDIAINSVICSLALNLVKVVDVSS